MAKTLHGKVRYMFHKKPAIVDGVWKRISTGVEYTWDANISQIRRYVPRQEYVLLETLAKDPWQQNIKLRNVIEPLLHTSFANQRRIKLFTWIVKGWGGIQAGNDDVFPEWSWALNQFDEATVWPLTAKWQSSRISSWSKILSFANHRMYPVYDSKNSTALNVILIELERPERFYMPEGQNGWVRAVRKHIAAQKKTKAKTKKLKWAGYKDYADLLGTIAAQQKLDGLLPVEMSLFAKSDAIVREYADRHKLKPLPPPKPKKARSIKAKKAVKPTKNT